MTATPWPVCERCGAVMHVTRTKVDAKRGLRTRYLRCEECKRFRAKIVVDLASAPPRNERTRPFYL